jgi:hypothetical protein
MVNKLYISNANKIGRDVKKINICNKKYIRKGNKKCIIIKDSVGPGMEQLPMIGKSG